VLFVVLTFILLQVMMGASGDHGLLGAVLFTLAVAASAMFCCFACCWRNKRIIIIACCVAVMLPILCSNLLSIFVISVGALLVLVIGGIIFAAASCS
jgi:hypothetical protein